MKVKADPIFRSVGRVMRGSLLVLFFFYFAAVSFAQLLDSTELQQQKVYLSPEEAMVNPSVVYRLDLSKQHLQFIPDNVFKLTRLQELNLSRNKIQYIPTDIGLLKNLQVLNLADNKLKTLPSETGQLTNLKYLYLKRNKIGLLPVEMEKLTSLVYLDLWGNTIIQLPVQMSVLTKNLHVIDMRGILIKPEYRNAITDLLPDTKVYFSGCNCN
jgi:Leucine-rich repeat (LRR) protein